MPVLRACARCGTPFTPANGRQRWCAIHAPRADDRSPTTRTRPSSSTERDRIRRAVLERDHYVCQIALVGCTTAATVADHILAAEHGGRYEMSNLRAACHHCNSVRGGRREASPLEYGRADGHGGSRSAGGARPAPVGPTRLA